MFEDQIQVTVTDFLVVLLRQSVNITDAFLQNTLFCSFREEFYKPVKASDRVN